MRDLEKLRALSAEERRLLGACLLAVPWMVAGLRLLGLRRMKATLERWRLAAGPPTRRTREVEAARAQIVARVAGIAAGRGPIRATCLRRSLLVWWLLRREGIETTIRIGVLRDGADLRAHAWVEHDGTPLGEEDDPRLRYASFDRDFAAAVEARP